MKDLTDTPALKSKDGNPQAVSIRIEPRTMSKAKGTRRHDFRIGKLPKYVKADRVKLNRTLMPLRPLGQIKKENAELRIKASRQRAMKQNAPVIMSGIITFGTVAAKLFESLPIEQQDAAFRELAKGVASELNTSLESLVVHLDETTIHAHFTLRAYTNAGLSMSEAAKRGTLSRVQDLAAEVMQSYHSEIERGHRKWDRIAAGADYADTLHRSVRELHYDLPLEIETLRQQSAEAKRELEALVEDRDIQKMELDALIASAEKTRRHLAELDAKAVAAEKKEKRRRTYMARLAKKEAAIAAQKVALVQRTEAVEAAEAALAENTRAHVAREHELAQREQRQEEQAEEARIKSADLDARAGEISLEKEQVATARSELVTEAEEVRAQRIELNAGLAAIDHVVGAVEEGKIWVGENGKVALEDPAPIYTAPKGLRDRLMPAILRLVRKIDQTEKRASWVEVMMTRVRNLMVRSDLPKDLEKEARDLDADWSK
ncbi:plasmid recombination protein [Tritonibacter mobilis]|uniref:plasmid recombination protein n=1 Tax=Tritonibacter mobilis TaxID=379347 RepID=UPI0039A4BB9D